MKAILRFLQEAKDTKKSVKAIVKHGNEIIIVRRANDQNGGGDWDIPGGHLKSDETPVEGLRREVREEVGLEIGNIKKYTTVHIVIPENNVNSNLTLYKAIVADKCDVQLKVADWHKPPAPEHTEYKWIRYQDELERLPMLASLKQVVLKCLEARSNP